MEFQSSLHCLKQFMELPVSLQKKRKFYYSASLILVGLFLTQIYQLGRHLQIMHELPNGFEMHSIEVNTIKEQNRSIIIIAQDFRKKKTTYPVTWFNPISKIFFDLDKETQTFISLSFIGINFTYPGSMLLSNFLEILFTLLVFLFCLFNRRHYTSSFFDMESTFTQITHLIQRDLCSLTSPSIHFAQKRKNERWYLFKDDQKLGPYTLYQVEYLVDEKSKIKEYMCMSTYDHRVYKVKNIIDDTWEN